MSHILKVQGPEWTAQGSKNSEQTNLLGTRMATLASRTRPDRASYGLQWNRPIVCGAPKYLDWTRLGWTTGPDRGLDHTGPDVTGPDRTRPNCLLGRARSMQLMQTRLDRRRQNQTGADQTGLDWTRCGMGRNRQVSSGTATILERNGPEGTRTAEAGCSLEPNKQVLSQAASDLDQNGPDRNSTSYIYIYIYIRRPRRRVGSKFEAK